MTNETPATDNKPQKPADVKAADKPKGIEKLDFTKPIAITLHQTEARNHFEIFNSDDAVEDAKKHASAMALNQDRTVAVFGPQVAVKVPPKEPQADDLELNF